MGLGENVVIQLEDDVKSEFIQHMGCPQHLEIEFPELLLDGVLCPPQLCLEVILVCIGSVERYGDEFDLPFGTDPLQLLRGEWYTGSGEEEFFPGFFQICSGCSLEQMERIDVD